jgi:hypothetical protein
MLKALCTVLVLTSAALAQSSSDGSFAVHHIAHANFVLTPAQLREAESIYQNACAVVQHDFHSSDLKHPHVDVIVGTDRDLVHGRSEIWMTKWDRDKFAQGIVLLLLLNTDVIEQLSNRAVRYSDATINVSTMK